METDFHNPDDSASRPFDKHFHLILLSVLCLALALRIAALLSLKETLYFNFLLCDEKIYHDWAVKIADGTFQSSSVYEFAPLFAYVMAFIYKLFSPDVLYIRILNTIFGVLTCYLIYLIGKELGNRKIGLVACLIASLYEPFIFYSIVPLKASLSVFLFASTIYILLAVLNRNSLIKVLLLGMTIGFMLNVRPQSLVVIPLLPMIVLWNLYEGKSSLKMMTVNFFFYVVGFSIAISPFVARNYRVAGELALITSQSGFNLYMANKIKRPGPSPFASTIPSVQGIQHTIEASRRVGKKISPVEASSYWTRETFKTAREQPALFVRHLFRKTVLVFQQFQVTDHYCIDFMSRFVTFFRIPFFTFNLILPLGMAGIAVTLFGSGKVRALFAIFVLYASTLVIFFALTRYKLPLLVILIPLAVMGISSLFSYIKGKKFKGVGTYLAIALLFVLIEFFPVRPSKDLTAYYNGHAIILSSNGLEDEAMEYWKESSRMRGFYSDFANISLARRYLGKRDFQKASYYLDRIPESSFTLSEKYELQGDSMMLQGQVGDAIEAYERSLGVNSGRAIPRVKLIRIYDKIDKEKAREEYRKLKYISSFYDNF